MRSADKQIVSNQPGDVRGQGSITEVLPPGICEPPNINWKGDAFRNRAQRCGFYIVSATRSDALKMADSFHELDEQTSARLTRSIVGNEFPVHRILCGLRVARDPKRDGVIRVRP